MSKKINYAEGDCFFVPLREGGYARGVVARMSGDGAIFGYFFGPKIEERKKVCVDAELIAENAIFVGRFGDLGLLNKEWQVVGSIPDWSRDRWSMPPFLRYESGELNGFLSTYDDDSLEFENERKVKLSTIDVKSFPYDSSMGYRSVEVRLTKLLSLQS